MHWLERTALGGYWLVVGVALFGLASTGGPRGDAGASEPTREAPPAAARDASALAAARCSHALATLRAADSPLGALACFARDDVLADGVRIDATLPGAPLAPPES